MNVEIRSPFDGAIVGSVRVATTDEVAAACETASGHLAVGLHQHQRAEILERAVDALLVQRDRFASLICREAGKPISAAGAEVDRAADTLRFSALEARRLAGHVVPMEGSAAGAGRVGFTFVEPVGVVAAISPFNFPLNLVAHKVGPAVAAGCPVVLKPAEATPLTALALVSLLGDVGLPPGWISVVCGGPDVGRALVADDRPAMISFTGSSAVGWAIASAAPRKRVALELGSCAPVVVASDADLTRAAAAIVRGGFGFAGQSCISTQRVLAHRSVAPDLLSRLEAAVAQLVVGDPADARTDVGPLISLNAAERVERWIDDAASGGARVVCGGTRAGSIVQPTIVVDPPLISNLWTGEVFGPVVGVRTFDTIAEAIDLANDTDLALQAGCFTADLDLALRFARALDFGGVLVNDVPTFRADQQPYGGRRDGGNTLEGPRYAVQQMTLEKLVVL